MGTGVVLNFAMIVLMICLVSGEKIDSPIPCRNTSDCLNIVTLPNESFCKDGFCICPNTEKGFSNCSSIDASIHERRALGPLVYRTCKHNQDCAFQGGFCNTTISQCYCFKSYVPSSNKKYCVEKVKSINAPCADENQCLGFLANTTCDSFKCVCISGYHYVDDACSKIVEYEEPCEKDQECSHFEGAICTDDKQICECPEGTVPNADLKKCLRAVSEMRDECTESAQCSAKFEHALCVNQICQCDENYHYEDSMKSCFPNKEIDAACASNYECHQAEDYENDPLMKSLMCEDNRCICIDGFIREENICVNDGSKIDAFASVSLIALICSLLL